MKGGSSSFIAKYYFGHHPKIENSIVMDFYEKDSFREYITRNKQTMSIWTKLHLTFQVVQGLRYIKGYDIVHLDLKPRNLMFAKPFILKLIDFGESYHPRLCDPCNFSL